VTAYDRGMPLRKLFDDIWVSEAPFRTMGLSLGARTTIVRLPGGDLVVHSPGPPGASGEVMEAVRALGHVRVLLAPNTMHHLFYAPWAAAFPEALRLGAAGVAAKQPGLRIRAIDAGWTEMLEGALEIHAIEGMPRLRELAVLHRASGTLVLTDLCFHMRRGPWLTRTLMRLNGGWNRFGPTRLCRSMIEDPAAVRASLDALLAWEFERIVVGHGDVVESGGRDALRNAFAWLCP
jgi:hypothetical protein